MVFKGAFLLTLTMTSMEKCVALPDIYYSLNTTDVTHPGRKHSTDLLPVLPLSR